MTIDEAQTMLNAKAKCIERICKGIYEDCNEQNSEEEYGRDEIFVF